MVCTSSICLELELELLVYRDTSVCRSTINTTSEHTRGTIIEKGISKNGLALHINAEHSALSEVEVDVETLRVSGGDLWGVLGVVAGWANLDGTVTALGGNDHAVLGRVAAEIFGSILSKDIKPDDGVRAESAVSPVPAGHVGGEWFVPPVLKYQYKTVQTSRDTCLIMVTNTGELEGSAKNGEVCNSIRIRHSISPPHVG